jgi:hypothetical protein
MSHPGSPVAQPAQPWARGDDAAAAIAGALWPPSTALHSDVATTKPSRVFGPTGTAARVPVNA